MKKGGVKEIVVGHIFWALPVWSVPPPPKHWHWHPHTQVPLHWTFHPWSNKEAPENVLRNAQSFLFTQPKGVSPVWHWAGGRQFTPCSTSLFSLYQSLLLQDGGGTPHSLSPHTWSKGIPIMGWWEKVHSDGGLMSVQFAGFSQGRKGHLQQLGTPLHMVPPPTDPSLFSSLGRYQL